MLRTALTVMLLAACDVGSVLVENGTTPDASTGVSPDAKTAGPTALTVTFTTAPTATPLYQPSNCVVVWIENDAGALMKTIGRWAEIRKQHLVAWSQKAGTNDVDALTGATRLDHTAPLTATWDLQNRQGTIIPDGTYTIRIEAADNNALTPDINNQGTFTFIKGPQAQNQPNLTNGNFTNVTIDYKPI